MSTTTNSLSIQWRQELKSTDPTAIADIVQSTKVFTLEEIECAVELAVEALKHGIDSGYHFIFAEHGSQLVGYTCYGPISLSDHSFDLYWIAVHQKFQQHKIGQQLLTATEHAITALHGKHVYIETSMRDIYLPAQNFYLKHGYTIMATLDDFYRENDGKIIYRKILG